MATDFAALRAQFPTLHTSVADHPLRYLDSAASCLSPLAVLEAMDTFERTSRANVHRGVHALAERASDAYEQSRVAVQHFVNAAHADEIIFTSGCTAAINLVARSYAGTKLGPGQTILLSRLEHHANIVPWQQIAKERNLRIRWIDLTADGTIDLTQYQALLQEDVGLVAMTGLSNVTGYLPPLQKMIRQAHQAGAVTLVDAAQLAAHRPVDVQELDCDFLACSSHKLYGPTGVGALYGKRELLADMPPMLGGGGMISSVEDDTFTPAEPPARFEAGTPPITQAVGWAAALNWFNQIPWEERIAQEAALWATAQDALQSIPGLMLVPPAHPENCTGCLSFTIEGIHPHDLTEILGRQGICLRAGHHCTQPLHRWLKQSATSRLSLGIYSSEEDIDQATTAIAAATTTLR